MNIIKKSIDVFFSMLTSILLMSIFAAAIGYATFAESSSGTAYARDIVYNALWFEVLLVLLIVNLIGSIMRYQLIQKRKFSILLFHLAFILMIIGAGITRYTGSEGIMHIRQGETSNEISSDKNSVRIIATANGQSVEKTTEASFSATETINFSDNVQIADKTISIEKELYVPNAVETIVPDDQGTPALALFVMNAQNQASEVILSANDSVSVENQSFIFADSSKVGSINFSLSADNQLSIKSTVPLSTMSMMEKTENMLMAGKNYPAQLKTIYKSNDIIFVIKTFLPKAIKNLTQLTPEMENSGVKKQGKDAIIFKVTDGGSTKRVNVFSTGDGKVPPAICQLGDVNLSISYGMLTHKLPFSITLREFQLERYAGSNSPSSYASEITVNDAEMKTKLPFRIYMNNILKYRGYRFFQSSYDTDEQGTILSVSNDFWGTTVSYAGYLLMMIGMVLTLFNKNSRFRTVIRLSNELQNKRKSAKILTIVGLILCSTTTFAQKNITKQDHIASVNKLLIQDAVQGRIEPFSTYASDVFRKIHKKNGYNGQSSVEVIISMSANPTYWANQPIIKVGEPQLAKELGAVNNYISFNQMFDFVNEGAYKLAGIVDKTYQKEPSTQSKYDKEVLYVDERVNICNEIFTGNMLALFPITGDAKAKWRIAKEQWSDKSQIAMGQDNGTTSSVCPAGGSTSMSKAEGTVCPASGSTAMGTVNDTVCPADGMQKGTSSNGMGISEEQLNNMLEGVSGSTGATTAQTNSPESLLYNYFKAFNEASTNGNWAAADACLQRISAYQIENSAVQLPSKTKINLEILYNKIAVFNTLSYVYIFLGFILLLLNLIYIFYTKPSLEKYLNAAFYPLVLVFVIYTAGMALRWYISDHAPWSNGYESMILVGWAAALSGLIFSRKSPISLSVTAILSGIALVVAAMSWMNPEITNLVPVLKSYWLIIHVAIITTSYGFLAMAALLGMLNLGLMIARNPKNELLLKDSIQEISYIIELSMIVGLFMLTVGCFIGGVWANESWGRYWGWDPKETWALVSILVYAVVLHLRKIKKLNNQFTLSSLALVSFSTIIMTFLGVNYYLTGMHSYAQGTAPSVPSAVYIVILVIAVTVGWAYKSEKKSGNI